MKLEKNIETIAKKVLNNEAEAILAAANHIGNDFILAVTHILNLKGRLVITGVGKSAIIAQKLVATFNSTGTPSLFMHAADAIHGDLGMIQPNDSVLCISKSGDTAEIKILVPLLKQAGQKLIAMVSNPMSYLATQADFVINAYVEKEACPLNLAPTTSTTLSLALGDAIAICLLEMREFTSNDFAKYHPGGALGKKLYLKVSDIYPNNAFPKVQKNATIKEVIFEISSKRLGATVVLDEKKALLGIITDGDIRRMLDRYTDLQHIEAENIMTNNPTTIDIDEFAVNALIIMQQKNITQLIAMKNNNPVGIVHLHDLLKEGLL